MRVLLDTNILLDVLLNRPGLADESEAVIIRGAELGGGYVCRVGHGLATAYYLLKRGRTEQEALAEVDRILAWAQVPAAGDTEARRARALGLPDFEDALQAASAEACAAEWIVTRDAAGFKGSPIPSIKPAGHPLRQGGQVAWLDVYLHSREAARFRDREHGSPTAVRDADCRPR